jgi:Fe-S cluster assembly iron-binding protein IscA
MNIIEFTSSAREAVLNYKETLQIPVDHFLRVGIKQKNSQDKGLLIGFDTKADTDRLIENDGVDLIYHPGQALFFAGMIIDYRERDGKNGFVLVENKKTT